MYAHFQYLSKINKLLKQKGRKMSEYAKNNKINVNKLYEYRKHINELNSVKETLLHYLVYKYFQTKMNLAKRFIENKKKTNKKNKIPINTNIIIFLCKNTRYNYQFHEYKFYEKMCELLRKCIKYLKCDLNIKNSLGQNVIHYAMDLGVQDIAYHIDKFYSNRYDIQDIIKDSEMVSIAYYNDFPNFINESINLLNPNKLYVNRISLLNFINNEVLIGNSEAPLHFISDNINVCKSLLILGANPNYRLKHAYNYTLCHVVCSMANLNNIKYLLKLIKLLKLYNFDFDLTVSRLTPLHILLRRDYLFRKGKKIDNTFIETVKIMLESMNNPNITDIYEISVIDELLYLNLWNKIKNIIISPNYKPFINLCIKNTGENRLFLDSISELKVNKTEKLNILFDLTKKYYCNEYIKNIKNIQGGNNKIIVPGLTGGKIKCNKLHNVLFNELGNKLGKILFNICDKTGENSIKNYNIYEKKLLKYMKSKEIKILINKINKIITIDWCKFNFVKNLLPAELLQSIYVLLSEYINKPIDDSIDILVNPITKETKKRYVFTTGSEDDRIFGTLYLIKKFSKIVCKDILNKIMLSYEKIIINKLQHENPLKDLEIIYFTESRTIFNEKKLIYPLRICMKSRKRYIITIIGIDARHANALIIDNKNKTIERFEPHGSITPFYDMDNADNDFIQFFTKVNKAYTYISPKQFESEYSFQGLSSEAISTKIGDPGGFCLTWSFVYIDLRLSNPNVKPKKLLEETIKIINNNGMHLVDYIRLYIKIIYKLREDILDTIDITYDDLLAVNITPEQGRKLIKLMKISY